MTTESEPNTWELRRIDKRAELTGSPAGSAKIDEYEANKNGVRKTKQ